MPPPDKRLFTPGPLTTSRTVKEAMLRDVGSRDDEFIALVRDIRHQLLKLGGVSQEQGYEAVLIQGSGTFGIEGLDLVDATRHACPTTRFVLLTANGSPEIEIEARRRGATVCLQKPVSLPALAATIGGMLRTPA